MSLKLYKGGSQITFSQDVKCCILSCKTTRDENRMLPFYTFPSDITLCREWLKEIQLDDDETKDLEKLHTTHVVCSKHFQPYNGGMKLCVNKTTRHQNTNSTQNETLRNITTSTQTYDKFWIATLKQKYGVQILCHKHIQCRVCASTSVEAMSIYSRCNSQLQLENLINTFLPIKVTRSDTKPLNICVHCLFKLRQFIDLYNCCKNNENDFESPTICIQDKNKNKYLPCLKNTIINQIVPVINIENTNSNTERKNDENNSKTSNPHDFIKKENRKNKIKIQISTKNNNKDKLSTEKLCLNNTSRIICVEFMAKYIICNGKEWVYEIEINENELKYSQETIDHILVVIRTTMKNQCEKNNSRLDALAKSPKCLEKNNISHNNEQVQTISANDELCKKSADILERKKTFEKTLTCEKCNLQLNNEQLLNKHVEIYHPRPCRFRGEKISTHENEHGKPLNDGFICHLCGHKFKTYQTFNCHYKQHLKYEESNCTTCNLKFINDFALRKHIREQHKELDNKFSNNILNKRQNQIKVMCSICKLWLSSKIALRVHMKTHLPIEERIKACPVCKKQFISLHRFKWHVETHQLCKIRCVICSRLFPNQKHLENHLKYHKIIEQVSCDICQKNYKSRATLNRHILRVHQGKNYVQKKFTCLFCKIVFDNKEELELHSTEHTPEEKAQEFSGDQCGKIQCNVCNKNFLYKSRLTLHKIYHHKTVCQQCGKNIKGDMMNHHCKKGSKALKYCCQYCTKRFNSKRRLNFHERTNKHEQKHWR